jgi:osomolarity two-component system, sensor histidine kinase NIK1
VTKAVTAGDLSQYVDVDVRGMAELKATVSSMVEYVREPSFSLLSLTPPQLQVFAKEVTRVALEVGSLEKLGAQALVEGAKGKWKDLTYSVNVRLWLVCSNVD